MNILYQICFILYYESLQIVAKQEPVTIATLGRPFRLGMLYDMRSDKIITGATLWDPENLANNTSTYVQPYTGFEVITDDSLQDKAHALGVEASLKLSMVGGLIDISGSAKYAENSQQTRHETRLSLKYSTTTHFEQLTMKQLGKGNLNHPDLHDLDLATHVVTGVLYGAEAFFVFDRVIAKEEDKRDVSGQLRVLINKIPTLKVDGSGKLNMNDQQQEFVDRLDCKFYGDFRLSENPSTFAEAVRIYRELPSLLGKNNENAIPKKVWLYPLNLLDSKAMRVVRDISSKLVDYTISVIEDLHSFEVTALDLTRNQIFTHFNHLKNQLLDFAARLSEFQRVLKEKIVLYLPQLRGNTGIEESVLFDLFKKVDSSPFNKRALESWLSEKQQVISLATALLETLMKYKNLNVTIKSSSLDGVDFSSQYDYTYSLSLRFVEENDPQLSDMYKHLYSNNSVKPSQNSQSNKTWFTDQSSLAKIRKDFRQFTDFAIANNVENRKIKFIVDEEFAVNRSKTTQLVLYDDESTIAGFVIPSKPGAPYAKNITENNLTLAWIDAANGSEKIIQYRIMYRQYTDKTSNNENEVQSTAKWVELKTSSNRQEVKISQLPPTITFEFQVQSVTAIGLSPMSDLSKPITILGAPAPICVPPCSNCGICTGPNTCACTSLWTGPQCERPVCTPPCSNGGTCTAPNFCTCPSLWTGFRCETKLFIPLRATSIEIHPNASWEQHGTTVAGGNGQGSGANQLHSPCGLFVDDNHQTIYIADYSTHRVIEWKFNAASGRVAAGGNGQGSGAHQLSYPQDVIVDKEKDSLIIADYGNNRVVRWPRQNGNQGETIISNIACTALTMDRSGSLYVIDYGNCAVRRYRQGETQGSIVAGGNGNGKSLTQLSNPYQLFVDQESSVYVSELGNSRVTKWIEGAKQGIVVAGTEVQGNDVSQLSYPRGVIVDRMNTIYVVDSLNARIMRWTTQATKASIIIGGNGEGAQSNYLNQPVGLSFDRYGNLYVADPGNSRVQKFNFTSSDSEKTV